MERCEVPSPVDVTTVKLQRTGFSDSLASLGFDLSADQFDPTSAVGMSAAQHSSVIRLRHSIATHGVGATGTLVRTGDFASPCDPRYEYKSGVAVPRIYAPELPLFKFAAFGANP